MVPVHQSMSKVSYESFSSHNTSKRLDLELGYGGNNFGGSTMHALITGSAGFIGSHLTEACLELGWKVTALDSLTTYYSPREKADNAIQLSEHPDCRYLEEDLLDVDLDLLLRDVDVIFHLAAQAGVRASWGRGFDAYTQLNVTALQRLAESARLTEGLSNFVFASSSSVYGDAETLPTTEDQIFGLFHPTGRPRP